jgi:hypothetical protein
MGVISTIDTKVNQAQDTHEQGYTGKYATKYDSNGTPIAPKYRDGSGYRKETAIYQQNLKRYNMDNVVSGKVPGNAGAILNGSRAEQDGMVSGMNTAAIGYGQGLSQTGDDIQRIKELQRGRTDQSGGDPVSAAIMGQKASATAGAQRNLASSGVKGGVAAGAIANVGRAQDADIAASLYGQQRQSIADERSLASNTLAGTTGLMYGEKAANVKAPSAPDAGGSVICTELHRQGIMSPELYLIDTNYGISLYLRKPEIVIGYRLMARPVAKLMAKSRLFTVLISSPAMAWARNMAGEKNLLGGFISLVGEPICGIIGKIKSSLSGAKYV